MVTEAEEKLKDLGAFQSRKSDIQDAEIQKTGLYVDCVWLLLNTFYLPNFC